MQMRDRKATVKYLKNLGPEEFRNTLKQEDAQQYLGKLLQFVEFELNKLPKGVETFNSVFKTEYNISINCKECGAKRQIQETEYHYINTYGTKENFKIAREEVLD